MKYSQKGFTLIELLLSLGLLGVVVLIVFSFLLTNINNYERNESEIELQQNVRTATEFITKEVVRAKVVLEVKNKDGIDVTNEFLNPDNNNSIEIRSIVLSILEEEKDNKTYNRIMFDLVKDGEYNKLKYGYIQKKFISNYTNMDVAFYIDKITAKPILDENNKEKGIILKLYPKKDEYSLAPVETSVYFRNHN